MTKTIAAVPGQSFVGHIVAGTITPKGHKLSEELEAIMLDKWIDAQSSMGEASVYLAYIEASSDYCRYAGGAFLRSYV